MPHWHRGKGRRRDFSVKTRTVMDDFKLALQVRTIAIRLCHTNLKGISSLRLCRELEVRRRTAWFHLHRPRDAGGPVPARFEGMVEVDKIFIGGKSAA